MREQSYLDLRRTGVSTMRAEFADDRLGIHTETGDGPAGAECSRSLSQNALSAGLIPQ